MYDYLKVYRYELDKHGNRVARLHYRANFVSLDTIKSLRRKYKQELKTNYAGSVARRQYGK